MTPAMVSGHGKYHGKNVGSYADITYEQIQALVDTPQRVKKDFAQWVIPSTLMTRVHSEQRQFGEYWMLWGDLDTNPPTVDFVQAAIESIQSDYEIYASRSATLEVPKGRILIPLAHGLSGADWRICQKLLNDQLERAGMRPDRSTERSAQPCYLPNIGEHYFSRSRRDGRAFDINRYWQLEIESERESMVSAMAQKEVEREARDAEHASQQVDLSKSLIHAFNDAFDIREILVKAGYDQLGDKFRHPNSQSGSFSANVKNGRVYTFSSNDPLYCEEGAHDAFSAFTALYAGGDISRALRLAGDSWLMVKGEPWNEVRSRERAVEEFEPLLDNIDEITRALIENAHKSRAESLGQPEAPATEAISPPETVAGRPFCLSQFALNGQSSSMQAQMLSDVYVIGRIAILGQVTAIFAPPNAGKTLITIALLIETLKAKTISPENIFYINADDNAKGLLEKLRLAEKYGFLMLAPGLMGFRLTQTESYLTRMIGDDSARGKVIILDTVKKFTDIMDKRACSEFGKVIRAFVQSGGSAIMLAHVNKHRDIAGRVVAAGTSDMIDDADCAYLVDSKADGNEDTLVIFQNKKSRGDVDDCVSYRYTRTPGQGYEALVNSVQKVGDEESKLISHTKRVSDLRSANRAVIDVLMDVMRSGVSLKNDVVSVAMQRSHFSRGRIRTVLSEHSGNSITEGHFWEVSNGEKHSLLYKLLPLYAKMKSVGEGAADTAYMALDADGPPIEMTGDTHGQLYADDVEESGYTAFYDDPKP